MIPSFLSWLVRNVLSDASRKKALSKMVSDLKEDNARKLGSNYKCICSTWLSDLYDHSIIRYRYHTSETEVQYSDIQCFVCGNCGEHNYFDLGLAPSAIHVSQQTAKLTMRTELVGTDQVMHTHEVHHVNNALHEDRS